MGVRKIAPRLPALTDVRVRAATRIKDFDTPLRRVVIGGTRRGGGGRTVPPPSPPSPIGHVQIATTH